MPRIWKRPRAVTTRVNCLRGRIYFSFFLEFKMISVRFYYEELVYGLLKGKWNIEELIPGSRHTVCYLTQKLLLPFSLLDVTSFRDWKRSIVVARDRHIGLETVIPTVRNREYCFCFCISFLGYLISATLKVNLIIWKKRISNSFTWWILKNSVWGGIITILF